MSVTGVLLGYERQMIAWFDGAPTVSSPSVARSGDAAAGVSPAARLPLDSLLATLPNARAEVASVMVRMDASSPVAVRLRDRALPVLALDPYNAKVIPTPQGGRAQAFFSALRRWHRWMGATAAEGRARARALTGAANLIFLFLVLSGLYLWWPRQWNLATLRNALLFRRGLRGKARDFNWHHALGFWSAVPLALVVATGVFISYQWPGRLLDRAFGSPDEKAAARRTVAAPLTADARRTLAAAAAPRGGITAAGVPRDKSPSVLASRTVEISLDTLLAIAVRARPEWTAVTITLASPKDSAHTVLVAGGNTLRPDMRTTVVVDAATGAELAQRDFASLSTSRKIRAWVRFGHTGEVFGLAGQTLATLVTLAGAVLVWTGIALSLRRFAAWRRRRRRGTLVS